MKAVLILSLVLLFTYTLADVKDIEYDDAKALIGGIQDGMDDTFVILFFDEAADKTATQKVRDEIKSKVLDKHTHFHYYEVPKSDKEFKTIQKYFELDEKALTHAPITLITRRGKGFWAHGDGATDEIIEKVPSYSAPPSGSKK